MLAIAGLALLGTIGNGLASAMIAETHREAAMATFLVNASRAAGPFDKRDVSLAVQAEKRLAVPMRILQQHLTGRDGIAADRFTVADVNVASVLTWARPARDLMSAHPEVAAWMARCLERQAQMKVRAMARAG